MDQPKPDTQNIAVERNSVTISLRESDIPENTSPMPEITKEQAGRYFIKGEKGRGGIGKVMIALDSHIGREIAIKELLVSFPKSGTEIEPESGKDKLAELRFLREARVTGQLEHPGIVPVYEIGKREDSTPYYTMRLVRGNTLAKAIKDAKNLKERLLLLPHFRDICNAIAYSHSRGVVHRDIKPDNIMLGEFGETIVLDWGLAKVHGEKDERAGDLQKELSLLKDVEVGNTLAGKALGTPAYMPPEQARGDIQEIDERSDIYSLGAVLYEILSGKPPFEGRNAHEIIEKVMNSSPSDILTKEPEAPADLCAIARKTLSFDKNDRYHSALDVAKDIENYMSGGKVGAYEYSAWELIKRFVTQNKALASAIGILLFVLVSGSIVIFFAYKNAVENERMAHLNLALGYQENADRMITERQYDKANVFSAAALYNNPYNPYSPYHFLDAKRLAKGDAGQQLLLAKSSLFVSTVYQNDALIKILHKYNTEIRDIAYSPDGLLLAVAGKDKTIKIWDIKKGKEIFILSGHTDEVSSVEFTKDGKMLASGSWDKTVKLWDMQTRTEIFTFTGHEKEIYAISFSTDGQILASAGDDKIIKLWDIANKKMLSELLGHRNKIRSIAFSPDGKLLVSGGVDGEIRLWDKEKSISIKGHSEAVVSIKFAPNGRTFASASYDKTVKIWDATLVSDPLSMNYWDAFFKLAYSPDGSILAIASRDGTIKLINIRSRRTDILRGHEGAVFSITFSPDSKILISAGADKTLRQWKTDIKKSVLTFEGHRTYIPAIIFSPDGKTIASSSWDKTIKLWDIKNESEKTTFIGNNSVSFSLAFSPDGKTLASGGLDRLIKLWDIIEKKEIYTFEGHQEGIYSLSYSPDGLTLASGSWDHTVKLWDIKNRKLRFTLYGHSSSVHAVAFSPDGKILASAGRDSSIILWNPVTGEKIKSLDGHSESVLSLSFSPDGKSIVSAGEDKTVRIWDLVSGKLLQTLRGHTEPVNMVRFSPDGKLILSIGKEAFLWDGDTGEKLLILNLAYSGYSASFSPDGRNFALSDGALIKMFPLILDLWKEDPALLLKDAERNMGKKLEGFRFISTE